MAKILTHTVDGNKVTAEAALKLEQMGFHAQPITHEIHLDPEDYMEPEVTAEPCNTQEDA